MISASITTKNRADLHPLILQATRREPSRQVRAVGLADHASIQAVWATSQDTDNLGFRPRGGWWSLPAWATASRLVLEAGQAIGVAAIRLEPGETIAEGRLALLPTQRCLRIGRRLLASALALAQAAQASQLRLYLPAPAEWARRAAEASGFALVRTQQIMLRPAGSRPIPVPSASRLSIRPLRVGEEEIVLAALNRAWAETWNFRPLTPEALLDDLVGQRAGFLVAHEPSAEQRILGTVHALFDPAHQNPDGQPYAWISNLTTDPTTRGRGLGRALLTAGLAFLQVQGATSVTLGVDGGNEAAMRLYHSLGFTPINTVEIWERPLNSV
jgi:mycothiol synthase